MEIRQILRDADLYDDKEEITLENVDILVFGINFGFGISSLV